MRMLMYVTIPNEPFNTLVRQGTVGDTMGKILASVKPEAVYFTEQDGQRSALLVVHLDDASQIPAISEPWFLNFDADCQFRIAMTPEDLQRANLPDLGKAWG